MATTPRALRDRVLKEPKRSEGSPASQVQEQDPPPIKAERTGKSTIRMSLDLSPKSKEIVDNLAEEFGVSKADILRTAISLMLVAKEAEKRGEYLALMDDKGKVVRLYGI